MSLPPCILISQPARDFILPTLLGRRLITQQVAETQPVSINAVSFRVQTTTTTENEPHGNDCSAQLHSSCRLCPRGVHERAAKILSP
ncbi:hypothetical protein PAHAL_6G268900 [Panicum hallii]|uniref:Uncharacterized protein n=1 Tax=Panicum hallii TaxID=206008 RepID=A0A2T8IHQ0_9POAL|nr:hypothetical protein PAHAL_6G268900 [Panicum hallii]